MSRSSREDRIVHLLASNERCSVASLAEALQVSQVTVRSDLRDLEAKGLVVRVHGSALAACHPAMRDRQAANREAKEAIAKTAASLVSEGESVMICSGTTSALVARYLLGKKGINIVSNSTLILPYARVNSGLNITLVGGEFRPQSEAVVGAGALRELERYHASIAFLGTDGLTIEHGLTTTLPENAEIVRCMCDQADKTVLVCDSSKLGCRGFVKILSISDVDMVITDRLFPAEARREIEKLGVEVVLAGEPASE